MAKKLSINQFANIYGENYREYSNLQQTYMVMHYWAECGNANMKEEVLCLSHEARKELLKQILQNDVSSDTKMASCDRKLALTIIDTL